MGRITKRELGRLKANARRRLEAELAQGDARVAKAKRNSISKLPAYQKVMLGLNQSGREAIGQIGNLFGVQGTAKIPFSGGGDWGTVHFDTDSWHRDKQRFGNSGVGGWGLTGKIVGDMGLLAAPIAKGSKLVAGAAGKLGMGGLAKSRLAASMAQGGAYGAYSFGPEKRGTGTTVGALTGGGMTVGGQALKRTFGKGLVKATEGARDFMQKTNTLVPINLAAKEGGLSGGAKTVYQHVLRAMPGVAGKLNQQRDNALHAWQQLAIGRTLPLKVQQRLQGMGDARSAFKVVKKYFDDEAFETIKQYKINTSSKVIGKNPFGYAFKEMVTKSDKKRLKEFLDDRFYGKKDLTVKDLFEMRRLADEKLGIKLGPGVDRIIERNLTGQKNFAQMLLDPASKVKPKLGTKSERDLADYFMLKEPYANYKVVAKAMDAAKAEGGDFVPRGLARAVSGNSTQKAAGTARMQDVADDGLLGMDPTFLTAPRPGFFQQAAVTAPQVLSGAAGVTYPVGFGLTREATQRWLMGMTPHQQKLMAHLLKNQETYKMAGEAGRRLATTAIGQ